MKTINDSPFEFFKEGGWGFLVPDDNGENAVSGYFRFHPMYCATKLTGMDFFSLKKHLTQSADESTEESEFEAEGDDFEESSSDANSGYDDDGDASDDSEGYDDGSDSESGQDWDALEEKAAAADKKKKEQGRTGSDSEDDRPKKKGQSNGKSKR